MLDTLLSTVLSPVVPNDTRCTIYFSKDQRKRFDLRVLAEAKSSSPSLSFSLSLISFLPPPPLFSPHLSISFLSFPPSLPLAWSQTTAQIYRRWRDASGGQMREQLPVCLPYHSLWLIYRGGAFITLNYTLRLLPLPPAYAGRPWPYHLLGLPRRNVI